MTYILIFFLTYVLHLLLKLNWVCTAVVLVFLLVMQHFHSESIGRGPSATWEMHSLHPLSDFSS